MAGDIGQGTGKISNAELQKKEGHGCNIESRESLGASS